MIRGIFTNNKEDGLQGIAMIIEMSMDGYQFNYPT